MECAMKSAGVTCFSHTLLTLLHLTVLFWMIHPPQVPNCWDSQVTCQPADWLSLDQVLTGLIELFWVEECRKVLSRKFLPSLPSPKRTDPGTSGRICNSEGEDAASFCCTCAPGGRREIRVLFWSGKSAVRIQVLCLTRAGNCQGKEAEDLCCHAWSLDDIQRKYTGEEFWFLADLDRRARGHMHETVKNF